MSFLPTLRTGRGTLSSLKWRYMHVEGGREGGREGRGREGVREGKEGGREGGRIHMLGGGGVECGMWICSWEYSYTP